MSKSKSNTKATLKEGHFIPSFVRGVVSIVRGTGRSKQEVKTGPNDLIIVLTDFYSVKGHLSSTENSHILGRTKGRSFFPHPKTYGADVAFHNSGEKVSLLVTAYRSGGTDAREKWESKKEETPKNAAPVVDYPDAAPLL